MISYKNYIKRFFEIERECGHENYLCEILIPFLRACCPEGVKIVPVFDDRKTGPKTDNITELKRRFDFICAKKKTGKYVVPDYIFVDEEYSFFTPRQPYLMVEAKWPRFLKDGKCYLNLTKRIKEFETELKPEIEAFNIGAVLFTDGITWMILALKDGCIIEKEGYKTKRLFKLSEDETYYRTNYYETVTDDGVFEEIKQKIKELLLKKRMSKKV